MAILTPPAYLRLFRVLTCSAICLFPIASEVAGQDTYVNLANRLVETPPRDVVFSRSLEDQLYAAVNAYRQSKGIKALQRESGRLAFAARAHAMDLLKQGQVGHRSSNGFDFESRMRALRPGEAMLPVMGENAARSTRQHLSDQQLVSYLMQQWGNSPSHRKTMLSRDYITVATAVVRHGDVAYAVQIFRGPEVKTNFRLGSPAPDSGLY